MLGASEYANVKTKKDIKVGQEREPAAEYTFLDGSSLQGARRESEIVLC